MLRISNFKNISKLIFSGNKTKPLKSAVFTTYALGLIGCNKKPARTPGFEFGLEKVISLPAVAILKAKNKRYTDDKNRKDNLRTGLEITQTERPVITAMATKLVPKKSPKIYFNPVRHPNAAPIPAVDNTPGPGVIIRKKTANAKFIIGPMLRKPIEP